MNRRNALQNVFSSLLATAAAALLFAAGPARAQYPAKPVKLIVPFPAGGATDAAARDIADGLTKALGQSFVVENRPGADGAIAAHAVLDASADGYTLFFASSSIEGVPLVQKTARFKSLADFTPVSLVCRLSFGLVTAKDVPAKSVQDLVAYLRANPGKLNYGSGSLSELMAAGQFMKATGTRLVRVNYKGGAQVATDLAAGQVQVSFGPMVPMLPLLADKRVNLVAMLGDKRVALAPDTPSLDETGIKGVSGAGGLQAVLAPPGAPAEVVERLNKAIQRVMSDAALRQKFVQRGQEPQTSSPAELTAMIRGESEQWVKFAAEEGVRPE